MLVQKGKFKSSASASASASECYRVDNLLRVVSSKRDLKIQKAEQREKLA